VLQQIGNRFIEPNPTSLNRLGKQQAREGLRDGTDLELGIAVQRLAAIKLSEWNDPAPIPSVTATTIAENWLFATRAWIAVAMRTGLEMHRKTCQEHVVNASGNISHSYLYQGSAYLGSAR
jgi:hypothetical protein